MHVAMAEQVGHTGYGRVSSVEHSHFHHLVRVHVVHEHSASRLPVGPATVDELVLDHPLHVVLRHYRPGVFNAVLLGQQLAVVVGSAWGYAINHSHGERHVVLNPLRQSWVVVLGQGQNQSLRLVTVIRDVVAREHREGAHATLHTQFERRGDVTHGAGGLVDVCQVPHNERVLQVQVAILVPAVSLLSDCQADHFALGRGHTLKRRLYVVGCVDKVQQGTHHRATKS
mmetsp:Transcript_32614/g.62644  ORF Transcript_32614/g.62644 Transcript_32614/m.62644 type:complete len:228 (-) Transcript_32614:606-1289(-)